MTTSILKQEEQDHVYVNVEFSVDGTRFRAELPVPEGPATVQDLLPVLHAVTDALVSVAEDAITNQGKLISCKKGCGACCRQLVPISYDEAAGIRDLLDGMPADRRQRLELRFTQAQEKLRSAGLLEKLQHPERFADDDLLPLGIEYFRLAIACPFLEEESCSIHADRPLACREYLVTSDPQHCAAPTPETISMVPMPAKLSRIITRIGAAGRFTRWQPLILATDEPPGSETGPAAKDSSTMPGPELLKLIFERLAEKPIEPQIQDQNSTRSQSA